MASIIRDPFKKRSEVFKTIELYMVIKISISMTLMKNPN